MGKTIGISDLVFRSQGSRLGRAHIYFARRKVLDVTKEKHLCVRIFMFKFSKSHCMLIIVWLLLVTWDHCVRDLNARNAACLTRASSHLTRNVWSQPRRKLCHTYLKLVQMISWSRCVSACDCVMTGCCNILSPFISRHTPMMWRQPPPVAPVSALLQTA